LRVVGRVLDGDFDAWIRNRVGLTELDISGCPLVGAPLVRWEGTALHVFCTRQQDLDNWLACQALTTLALAGVEPEVRHARAIGALDGLRHLDATGAGLTDEHLALVCQASAMETLSVGHCPISDGRPIAQLRHLRALDLTGTRVEEISWISGCQRLERIALGALRLGSLEPLTLLSRLRVLDVSGSVEFEQLQFIRRCTGIETLVVDNIEIGTGGFSAIEGMRNLRRLYVRGCRGLGEEVLLSLRGLPNLRFLGLGNLQVSEPTVRKLLTAHPGLCEIEMAWHALPPLLREECWAALQARLPK
jgi:Leucine-rich repeat (LRR) protein